MQLQAKVKLILWFYIDYKRKNIFEHQIPVKETILPSHVGCTGDRNYFK